MAFASITFSKDGLDEPKTLYALLTVMAIPLTAEN